MVWRKVEPMEERIYFIKRYLEGGSSITELCNEFGISRTTGQNLLRRFREEGLKAVEERSRRPLTQPRQLPNDVVCEILAIRNAHPTWGGKKIREILSRKMASFELPCSRTIDRILFRAGLSERRKKRSKKTYRIETVIKPKEPNDVWTVDFKGWWRTKDGSYCLPLTLRDEYSRFLLDFCALRRGDTEEVKSRFKRCFAQYGMPRYIRSDNGTPFASVRSICGLTVLSAWWIRLGVLPNRIPPGAPYLNGAHERLHRDIKAELQRTPARDLKTQQAVFEQWRKEFNEVRPHQALKMQTPSDWYQRSSRSYKAAQVPFEYQPNVHTRLVCSRGRISWRGKQIHISSALRGHAIGLEVSSDGGTVECWLRDFLLGSTDVDFRHPLGGEWVEHLIPV